MSILLDGVITLDNGTQIEISRCYDNKNCMDFLALGELQHQQGRMAIVTGTFIGKFVHSGVEVLVAHVITESRNVIDHDVFIIETWMKEHSPTALHHKRKVRRNRSWKDEAAADLGLIKVKGAVSGKVYYE